MLFFFLVICVISAVGSLQPGLVNLAVVQTVLARGLAPAIWLAVGGSLPEMLYAWLALQAQLGLGGWFSQFVQHSPLAPWLVVLGLAGGGLYYLSRPRGMAAGREAPAGPAKLGAAFGKGILLALNNFQLLVFWLLILVYLQESQGANLQAGLFQLAFVVGSGLGAFLFLLALALLTARHEPQIRRVLGQWANQWTGGILLLASVWAAYLALT
jgi:threonine/homoserine/homoserine lactone efflux protein